MPRVARTWQALLAIAIALITGCGASLFSPEESLALQQAEARWEAARPSHYTIEMRRLCFCTLETTEWATVEVRGGAVVATTLLSGEPVPEAQWSVRPSVAELFATLHGPWPVWVADVTVTYDPTTGYPTVVNMSSDEGVADAGWTLEARNLIPLE